MPDLNIDKIDLSFFKTACFSCTMFENATMSYLANPDLSVFY